MYMCVRCGVWGVRCEVWGVGVPEEVVLSAPVNSLAQWSIDLGVKLAVANPSEQHATFELGMLIALQHMPTPQV